MTSAVGVMLGIGLLISELTARLRSQLRASQQREHRTAQLYRLTRQLSELAGTDFLVSTAGRHRTGSRNLLLLVLNPWKPRSLHPGELRWTQC